MLKINLYTSLFILIFASTIIHFCIGQSTVSEFDYIENEKTVKLNELLQTYADYGDFNGSVLVAEEGRIIYKKGFGFANMEWNIPNQTDTKFRIGSITKQFTAMLIMQLVAEKKVDLYTPISNYLPDYPKDNANEITIHHLLTHSSGIPNSYESTKSKPIKPDNYKAEELVNEFSHLPLEFKPGQKFSYCNAGYTLLGLIIEKITGKTYESIIQEKIFDPLKMKNSGFDKHRQLIPNRAQGYFKSWGEYYNSNYIDMSSPYAAGALYSTVEDMYLWNQSFYSNELIPKEYIDLSFYKHEIDKDYNGHYGYGWAIINKPLGNSQNQVETLGHDGVIDGFCALYTQIPSTESMIVLLSNIRRAPLNAMTKGIMGILHNEPYDFPKKSLAYTLLDKVNHEGINKGIQFFNLMSNDNSYYTSEDEINIISYNLLEQDKKEAAERVLQLGISVFPEAFNLYDSLGEVQSALGKKEESIKNYKRSVKLNPENENGIRMLKELGVDIQASK